MNLSHGNLVEERDKRESKGDEVRLNPRHKRQEERSRNGKVGWRGQVENFGTACERYRAAEK